jgi:uncharacterized protein YkwD
MINKFRLIVLSSLTVSLIFPLLVLAQDECKKMSQETCEVLERTNRERDQRGRPPLSFNKQCQALAMAHAKDMAVNRYLSHTSPRFGPFKKRVKRFKVPGVTGENVAYGSHLPPAGVLENWMKSPGHRKNILQEKFRSMGVGYAINGSLTYYVQCFSSAP